MDKVLRCIVIDDEEGAHLVLEHYLKLMKNIELKASFFNAIQAMAYIYENPVDLIFLDINMPGLTGLEMLQVMSNPPLVILTTAYKEYALEGYRYRVVDYLVKPFDFPRFMAAIDNVFSRLGTKDNNGTSLKPPPLSHLTLRVDGDMIKVALREITHIQSMGNYVKVFAGRSVYISQVTTSEMEQKLEKTDFLRIHKSYIVGLSHISKITGAQVILANGAILPIGSTYRRELLERFQS